jgi:hypothetical protein
MARSSQVFSNSVNRIFIRARQADRESLLLTREESKIAGTSSHLLWRHDFTALRVGTNWSRFSFAMWIPGATFYNAQEKIRGIQNKKGK